MLSPATKMTHTKLTPARILRYIKARLPHRVPSRAAYQSALLGKTALEIGGPSEIFGGAGALPLYRSLESVDNCLYSARTIWTGELKNGQKYIYHPQKSPGIQFIADAVNLDPIPDGKYECVLASHCLEHVANPLQALAEWKRVLRDRGLLLVVLPHKDGTFDWRRPSTSLSHMVEDFRNHTREDDLTHLPEILQYHDLTRDKPAGTLEQFHRRCLDNYNTRAMHHHVFETTNALLLIDYAEFQLVRVDLLKPCHIFLLATSRQQGIDNAPFVAPEAEWRRKSPFSSDRSAHQ